MSNSANPPSVTDSASAGPPTLASRGAVALSDVLGVWKWVWAELEAGRLAAHRGQHVAVVSRAFIASGLDPWQLRRSVAETPQLDLERVVIAFVDDGE
jgi:hypothetical protein